MYNLNVKNYNRKILNQKIKLIKYQINYTSNAKRMSKFPFQINKSKVYKQSCKKAIIKSKF